MSREVTQPVATHVSGSECCGIARGGTAGCEAKRDRGVCGGDPVVVVRSPNCYGVSVHGCMIGTRSVLLPPVIGCGSLPVLLE